MSEAVFRLTVYATQAAKILAHEGWPKMANGLRQCVENVEAELNRTPQQLHEEAIARCLAEDQAQGVIR